LLRSAARLVRADLEVWAPPASRLYTTAAPGVPPARGREPRPGRMPAGPGVLRLRIGPARGPARYLVARGGAGAGALEEHRDLLRGLARALGDRAELDALRAELSDARAELARRGTEMYQNLNEFLLSTVKTLVSVIEAKDTCTSGHSTRVHLLSMLLGKELGLGEDELDALKWASILHDIGKIGMPESILKKPGQLTPEEYEIVKRHPVRGHQVLGHVPQLREASQSVLLHHERHGGGGYPFGIAGERIPRAARIIAVADTFDALTSWRPYRAPRSEDEAFREIRRVSGRQLDPAIIDALERMLPFLRGNLVMIAAAGAPEAA
jgi:HD-GYP domain-containing protein (c-di-GMP phosphodiesterase class II)